MINSNQLSSFLVLALSNLLLVQSAQVLDVHKFGAISDGVHKNTEAIAKAIAAAHDTPGGGTVNFPPGTYLTGPIVFKSNVHLHLEQGAILKFSDNFDDYMPFVLVRFEGIQLMNFSPLIYAYNVTNIGITGKGLLDGTGHTWHKFTKPWENEYYAHGGKNASKFDQSSKWQVEFRRLNADFLTKFHGQFENMWIFTFHFLKPDFFQPMHSEYITLEGVTFIDSPYWTVAPTYSDHIHIDGLNITNSVNQWNTDGIDPDSCRNVTINNCYIQVGDDAIAIKSGKDVQGREIGRPSENITITNLTVRGGVSVIAIGSEMSGGVRNVFASNITASGVWNGIRLKSCRGRGGVVENVHITNLHVSDWSKEKSIEVYPYFTYGCVHNAEHTLSPLTPIFRDIYITNFTGISKMGLQVEGLPEQHYSNIQLKDVHLKAEWAEVISKVDNFVLSNFTYERIPPHH